VIVATVEEHPGQTAEQLATMRGWTVQHTSRALTAARKAGKLDFSRGGGSARWYTVNAIGAVLKHERHQRRERERASQVDRNLRQRERLARLRADADGDADLDDQPIRRCADARAPLPFTVRAPASVFHLGAML